VVVDGAGAGLRGYGELDDDAVAGALWTRREGGAQRKNDRPLLKCNGGPPRTFTSVADKMR
jgi:hypothetical protein